MVILDQLLQVVVRRGRDTVSDFTPKANAPDAPTKMGNPLAGIIKKLVNSGFGFFPKPIASRAVHFEEFNQVLVTLDQAFAKSDDGSQSNHLEQFTEAYRKLQICCQSPIDLLSERAEAVVKLLRGAYAREVQRGTVGILGLLSGTDQSNPEPSVVYHRLRNLQDPPQFKERFQFSVPTDTAPEVESNRLKKAR